MDINSIFEKHNNEYIKFDQVQNKRSGRPDLHAFLLLDELFPGNTDMISASEHDEVYLSIDEEQIETLTEEQIIELVRCGVRYDGECLLMFA